MNVLSGPLVWSMQSLNLSSLEMAAKSALQRIVRPRYLHVVEPWVLRASPEDRKLVVRLLRTMEAAAKEAGPTKLACLVNENGVCVPASEVTCSIDALQMTSSGRLASQKAAGSVRPRSAPAAVNLRTTSAAEIYSMNFQPLSAQPCVSRMCQHWVAKALETYQVAVHNRSDGTSFLHLLQQIFAFAEGLGSMRPKTAAHERGAATACERLFQDSRVGRLVVEATAAVIQTRMQSETAKKKAVIIFGRRNIPATHAPHVVKTKPLQPNNIFLSASRVPGSMQTTYGRDFKPLQVTSWVQHRS